MMNKEQYLEALKNNLRNMPLDEIENITGYYREYFDDAGVDKEQDVISELGRPEILASKVSADYVIRNIENPERSTNGESINKVTEVKKGISSIWVIVLAICGFPIWFPFVITAAAIVFSIVITILSLLFAFAIAAVGIIAGGICALVAGFVVMFSHVPTGMAALGMGFILAGIGMFLLAAVMLPGKLVKKIIFAIAKIRIGKGVKSNE